MKILDCTLRDGGYYTDWDFDKSLVNEYLVSLNHLPVDYIEIGYRSPTLKGYYGEYFYMPEYRLAEMAELSQKSLVIMLNEKDMDKDTAKKLLEPCKGKVSMVRIAADPQKIQRAIELAATIKNMGFEVGFNIMYMSKWKTFPGFMDSLKSLDGLADYLYMVDSYGGVYPNEVRDMTTEIKSLINIPLGFHGHNNLELALINSLTAMEAGCEIIDATITGMGRGAGNLKTELFLTALNQKTGLEVDFNSLSVVTDRFTELQREHEWGANLPYMVSGANSLPQKDVMDWVGKRYYSINSIIRALKNQKDKIADNMELPVFVPKQKYKDVMIIGGGSSVLAHQNAILDYISKNSDIAVIHASSRNSGILKNTNVAQFFCLVGNEGVRMEKVFDSFDSFQHQCILPPYPRKMGTYIPKQILGSSNELSSIRFTSQLQDTHTALALQTAHDLGAENISLLGYDGYSSSKIGSKELELLAENESLFSNFIKFSGVELTSLTPTKYGSLAQGSIYQ